MATLKEWSQTIKHGSLKYAVVPVDIVKCWCPFRCTHTVILQHVYIYILSKEDTMVSKNCQTVYRKAETNKKVNWTILSLCTTKGNICLAYIENDNTYRWQLGTFIHIDPPPSCPFMFMDNKHEL